jgi:hypothetical protein
MFSLGQLYGHKFVYLSSFLNKFGVLLLTHLAAKLLEIIVS